MQVCNNMFIEIKINIVIMRHLLLKVFKKIRKVFVGGVKKNIHGKNNKIVVLSSLKGIGTLTITMRGNNNIVKVGQSCRLRKKNKIFITGDNNTIDIGNYVSFDQNVSLVCCEGSSIVIGDDSMFAANVRIRTSDQHPIYDINDNRLNYAKNVVIGNHVWLGASCLIMKGVSIGNNSVIGINSMVTKNIPDNCIAAGSPCKVIKNEIHWER